MPAEPTAIDSIQASAASAADLPSFVSEALPLAPDSFAVDTSVVDTAAIDTVRQIVTIEPQRYEGIPRKETFASQSGVTLLLLLQFFLLASSFHLIIKPLRSLFKPLSALDLSHQKALLTSREMIQSILLIAFSCINLAFLFYIFFTGKNLLLWQYFLPVVLGFFVLLVLKTAVFRLLGYVFFNKIIASFWIQTNFSICILFNILIFPLLVWVIYFQASDLYLLYTAVVLAIIGFFVLIYRLLIIFQIHIYSSFHIILYLCTLEIAPFLLLYYIMFQWQIFN